MTPRPDNRDKISVALDERERRALDYVTDTAARLVEAYADTPPPHPVEFTVDGRTYRADGNNFILVDGPEEPDELTVAVPDDVVDANVNAVYDRTVRDLLFDTFGTLKLPTDTAGATRLALRLLARTLEDIESNAAIAADAVDPDATAQQRELLDSADADMPALFSALDADERAYDTDIPESDARETTAPPRYRLVKFPTPRRTPDEHSRTIATLPLGGDISAYFDSITRRVADIVPTISPAFGPHQFSLPNPLVGSRQIGRIQTNLRDIVPPPSGIVAFGRDGFDLWGKLGDALAGADDVTVTESDDGEVTLNIKPATDPASGDVNVTARTAVRGKFVPTEAFREITLHRLDNRAKVFRSATGSRDGNKR